MSNPCVILEVSGADAWEPFRGCARIAQDCRPSVMHPSREVAEAEAVRLARQHPDKRFVVFEAVAAGASVKVPTHITLGGTVVAEQYMARLVGIGPEDIPF